MKLKMMKVTFLGTGSSVITAEKGFPSILIDNTLLLDCGEGTLQRLIQVGALDTITTICLTHLHGDHYMGVFSLLWYLFDSKRKRDLTIIGPSNLEKTLENILSLTFIKQGFKALRFKIHIKELPGAASSEELEGGYILTFAEMDHSTTAYAYRIEKGGKSICYSGDTKPTQKLTKLAKKSNLFICESTFLEKHKQLADYYGHSTITDAARMAQDADCEKLALVHLLPITIEALSESLTVIEKTFSKEILFPHDLMSLEI